ncbi:RES family NAD+ phosphorylase [Fulvivirga lutea]|uniref:RES family NAD+ phosphorylase n=1 Tax=Fulvivirga lutea TaxID=2810512 RepID=A0A974WFP2_9BACT|nr:RES family NAD+ phosphorylase [Fulvivirga lutea]QSE96904.1 RES family NAD+ phosphorylase [Fulvivirga lutea]
MKLYRIGHKNYIHDLAGTGGLYADGRWHAKGTRIVYFSEHISLAKLEVLANSVILPKNMSLMTVEVADNEAIKEITTSMLPESWDGYPYLEKLHSITYDWIKRSESLILKVPSAQATNEFNYLINPLHKNKDAVKVVSIEPIKFDRRLKF